MQGETKNRNLWWRQTTDDFLELKLSNNGGIDAASEQIRAKQYAEPFKADKRKVVALAIELDEKGKRLVDWKEV